MTDRADDVKQVKGASGRSSSAVAIARTGRRATTSSSVVVGGGAAAAVTDPSSMLSLRAALADATAAAAAASERRMMGDGDDDRDSRGRTGTGGRRRGRSTALEDQDDDRRDGKRSRSDRGGVKKRGGDDRNDDRKSERRRLREVKSSLERKARLYEEMRERGTAGAVDDDDVLVDFTRKGEGACSYELDRRGGLDGPCDDDYDHDEFTSQGTRTDNLVPVEDEFGRLVHVPADSSEYRQYLAEEARRVRREEIWGTSSGATTSGPSSGDGGAVVPGRALPVDGTAAPSLYSRDAVASSVRSPSTNSVQADGPRPSSSTVTGYSEAHVIGPSTVKNIRDRTKRKKEARLELIRQKQERLRRR